jgi:hypothetical protein
MRSRTSLRFAAVIAFAVLGGAGFFSGIHLIGVTDSWLRFVIWLVRLLDYDPGYHDKQQEEIR